MVMVPIMRKMEIENWMTTRTFRNQIPDRLLPDFPFKIVEILNEERTKAGYDPETSPTINPSSSNEGIVYILLKSENSIGLPTKFL